MMGHGTPTALELAELAEALQLREELEKPRPRKWLLAAFVIGVVVWGVL